jgi:hypothetical protein
VKLLHDFETGRNSEDNESGADVKLTDLRGILQYIPQFREKTFIIAVDGAIVTDENFANTSGRCGAAFIEHPRGARARRIIRIGALAERIMSRLPTWMEPALRMPRHCSWRWTPQTV